MGIWEHRGISTMNGGFSCRNIDNPGRLKMFFIFLMGHLLLGESIGNGVYFLEGSLSTSK